MNEVNGKEKQVYVVDSQILNAIQLCERKTNYTFERNFDPIKKPDYFEKGDLVHQLLADYYRARQDRKNWGTKTHADVVQDCIVKGRKASEEMQLYADAIEEVIRTFQEYTTYTAYDGWDMIEAIEQVASKVMYEDENRIILYQGKIDLIISTSNLSLLPIDHKSSSRRGRPEYLSNQFQGYCWLLGVNNILINRIGFQKTLKDNEKFERPILSYPPDVLEEWKENSIYWILKYIQDSESNFFPPNYTSCDKYSGCAFESVCRTSKELREYKLIQLFQERPKWDVGT
jgi:hypothetical protein